MGIGTAVVVYTVVCTNDIIWLGDCGRDDRDTRGPFISCSPSLLQQGERRETKNQQQTEHAETDDETETIVSSLFLTFFD